MAAKKKTKKEPVLLTPGSGRRVKKPDMVQAVVEQLRGVSKQTKTLAAIDVRKLQENSLALRSALVPVVGDVESLKDEMRQVKRVLSSIEAKLSTTLRSDVSRMRGWEGLAERVDALESQVSALEDAVTDTVSCSAAGKEEVEEQTGDAKQLTLVEAIEKTKNHPSYDLPEQDPSVSLPVEGAP